MNVCLKNIFVKLLLHLPGANELIAAMHQDPTLEEIFYVIFHPQLLIIQDFIDDKSSQKWFTYRWVSARKM